MKQIALMLRMELVGEDLNNEGTIGNVMQPRQIILENGEIRQSISGEMLKHFHTRNLRNLATDEELCDECKIFSPMKAGKVKKEDKKLSVSGNMVRNCIIDDVEGFMSTKGKNAKRRSCIQFSWAIATKENDYQNMLHTRVDVTEKGGKKNESEDKSAQMIFNRPLRNNTYASTVMLDLDRIGFDDEKLIYVLDEESIKERQKKSLIALRDTFANIEGASCTTRLPHLCGMEGIIVRKTDVEKVLTKCSPLKNNYREEIKEVCEDIKEFNSVVEFVKVIDELIKEL